MVLCLYPGSDSDDMPEPFEPPVFDERLERVTSYPDGMAPSCSARVPVDEALLEWLEPVIDEIEDWGDSLVVYRPRRTEVVAAVIPHEAVILVSDEHGSALAAAGYRVSADPPDWR